jgi:hypothetical protein
MLFILLEATFTFLFWAIRCKTEFGFGMTFMCAWAYTTLGYDELCSHNPLLEVPTGNLSLSTEELEALAAERQTKLRA